ncbi:MAG: hypothetical protein U1E76_27295 [Planctomycetota bacterium]
MLDVARQPLVANRQRGRAGLYSGAALLIGCLLYGGFVYKPLPAAGQLISSALMLCRLGAFDKAKPDLMQALASAPDSVDARLLLAHVEQNLGRPSFAAALYHDCLPQLTTDEQKKDVLLRLALNCLKSGRYWSARHWSRQLSSQFGADVRTYLIDGLSSYGMGDDRDYRDGVARAYQLDPTNPALRWNVQGLLPDSESGVVYRGAVISMVESLRTDWP